MDESSIDSLAKENRQLLGQKRQLLRQGLDMLHELSISFAEKYNRSIKLEKQLMYAHPEQILDVEKQLHETERIIADYTDLETQYEKMLKECEEKLSSGR
jgi:hypothetical protein